MQNGHHAHRFAHLGVNVYIPMLTIRRNIRLPKIPNEPVIHEPDIQFKTEIDEKQMKYMWLPFNLPTVTERIRLEWVTHYRSIFFNIPYEPLPKRPIPESFYEPSAVHDSEC